jgi:serine/threonine protein kinase
MTITSGENVGPYRVIEQLGSGGMATVFKAYHPALDRYVAIKILHPAFKADPQFFERFQREARIVAKLEHPHIIPVYDFNEHHGEPYLVMRFVEGETLKPEMHGQPLPTAEILRLMRPICLALSYAHQQGVLHRDIKPSNMMVTADGHVFLTDFGLARMVQAGESTLSQDMMVGTPQYISPEQAQGISNLDGRTDIYSLGVVLFEMFTGRVPFNADTPFATIHDHIYSPLPLPTTLNPAIDPSAERLLLKALAKDAKDRFTTADELLNALEITLNPLVVGSSITAKPVPVKDALAPKTAIDDRKRGSPKWVWVASAVMVVCILAGLLVGTRLWQRNYPFNQVAPVQVTSVGQPATVAQSQSISASPPASPASVEPVDTLMPSPDPNSANAGPAAEQQALELTQQATMALGQQQFAKAIELYRQAIAVNPHHLPAYYGLSGALRQSGDPAGSLAALEEAVAQNPDNSEVLTRLGEAYLVADQPEQALEAFEQVAKVAPESAGVYAREAIALVSLPPYFCANRGGFYSKLGIRRE